MKPCNEKVISSKTAHTTTDLQDNSMGIVKNNKVVAADNEDDIIAYGGIKDIVCGNGWIIAVKNDGTAWGCGYNSSGQLGLGDTTTRNIQIKIPIDNVKKVICEGNCTIFIKNDGTAWACGLNSSGQLGLGDVTTRNRPAKVLIDNVKEVKCENYNTIYIKNDGTIWGCGENYNGELGLGDTKNRNIPTKIPIDNVKEIICGNYNTIYIKNDGTIWGCGQNGSGELGLSDTKDRNIPTKIPIDNVKKVICKENYIIYIKNDGTAWGCGLNSSGQLGLGDTKNRNILTKIPMDNVKEIICGSVYTIFVKNDGTIWGCGENGSGQLGLSDTKDRNIPTKIPIDNVKKVICGSTYTIFIKNDGTIWGCGYNDHGGLGLNNGSTRNILIPTKAAIDDVKEIKCIYNNTTGSIFIKNNGSIWGSGYNNGVLGLGNDGYSIYIPTYLTPMWLHHTGEIVDKIYNITDIEKYGSWVMGYYGKDDLINRYVNFSNREERTSNLVVNEDETKAVYVLPNGWIITIGNYGMVNWYKDFSSDNPDIALIDGNSVLKIELGNAQNVGVVPIVYHTNNNVGYISPKDNSEVLLNIKQNEIKDTLVYHEKYNKSTHYLFQKTDGNLVYIDRDNSLKTTEINMNDVKQVIPATNARADYFLMKDGTLKILTGDVSMPKNKTVTEVLSNRFVKLNDNVIYSMQGTALKSTNTMSFLYEKAVNDVMLLKNGSIFRLSDSGSTNYLKDIDGSKVRTLVKVDENNTFVLMKDLSTKSIGDISYIDDLKSKGINYNEIAGFISNSTNKDNILIIMDDGTVYNYAGQFVDKVHIGKETTNFIRNGFTFDDTQPRDKEAPTASIGENKTSWTNDSVTLNITAADNIKVKSITLPDGTIVNGNKAAFTVNKNGTYKFVVEDTACNKKTIQYKVTNIDKMGPTKPIISKINGSIKITEGKDNESGIKQTLYKINGGSWIDLKNFNLNDLVIGDNTIYAKSIDKVGNESDIAEFSMAISKEHVKEDAKKNAKLAVEKVVSFTSNSVYGKSIAPSITGENAIESARKLVNKLPTDNDDDLEIKTTLTNILDTCQGAIDILNNIVVTGNFDKAQLLITDGFNKINNLYDSKDKTDLWNMYLDLQDILNYFKPSPTIDNPNPKIKPVPKETFNKTITVIKHIRNIKEQPTPPTVEQLDTLTKTIREIPKLPVDYYEPNTEPTSYIPDKTNIIQKQIINKIETDIVPKIPKNNTKTKNKIIVIKGNADPTPINREKAKDIIEQPENKDIIKELPTETENIIKYTVDLNDAIKAVERAESTQLQYDVNYARALVAALDNSKYASQQKQLNDRLDVVQQIINARNKAIHSLRSLDIKDINSAKKLINQLPDGPAKEKLTKQVDAIETVKDVIENSTDSNVTKLIIVGIKHMMRNEFELAKSDILEAQKIVSKITDSSNKTKLINIINKLLQQISSKEGFPYNKDIDEVIDSNVKVSDKQSPTIDITGVSSEWVNKDYTVMVKAKDNKKVKSITMPDGKVIKGDSATFTIKENKTYNFVAEDESGNVKTYELKISNIDKVAPTKPIIDKVNDSIKITEGKDNESGIKQTLYKINQGSWIDLKTFDLNNLVIGDNTVYAKSIDKVGNESEVSAFKVNIEDSDKEKLVVNITGNPTSWTNSNVTLNITTADSKEIKSITLPNGKVVNEDKATFIADKNGSYSFTVEDTVGNKKTDEVVVNKIDKEAPISNINVEKNKMTIVAKDSLSGVKEVFYKIDEGDFIKYSDEVILTPGTHTIYVKVLDNAGNINSDNSLSKGKTVIVKEDDNQPPTLNITGNSTVWTNKNITLNIIATDNKQVKSIILPNEKVVNGDKATFTVDKNGTYSFIVEDTEGNKKTVKVVVDKIDKEAPTSNINVEKNKMTIDTKDNLSGVKEVFYKIDKGDFIKYTGEVTLTPGNHTIYVKALDNVGNINNDDSLSKGKTVIVKEYDTEPPTLNIKGNPIEWTNKDVALNITAIDNKEIKSIKLPNGKVIFVADKNGTYSFTAEDMEGNKKTVEVVVNKIDKKLPTARITVEKSKMTIVADDSLSGVKEVFYKIDDGDFIKYAGEVTLTPGKYTIYAKVIDNAGNINNNACEKIVNIKDENIDGTTHLVEKAETTKDKNDINIAKEKISKLPAGNIKNDLNKRIKDLENQTVVYIKAYNTVEKTKETLDREDYEYAKKSLTELNSIIYKKEKDELQKILEGLETSIDKNDKENQEKRDEHLRNIEELVQEAIETKSSESIRKAQKALDQLENLDVKATLQKKLDKANRVSQLDLIIQARNLVQALDNYINSYDIINNFDTIKNLYNKVVFSVNRINNNSQYKVKIDKAKGYIEVLNQLSKYKENGEKYNILVSEEEIKDLISKANELQFTTKNKQNIIKEVLKFQDNIAELRKTISIIKK